MLSNAVALWNLTYDRTRLLVGIAGVGFAVLLVFINLGFLGALSETAGLLYNQLDAEIYLISPLSLNGTSTKPFDRNRLYQAAGVNGVQSVTPLYINYGEWRNVDTQQEFFLVAFGFNPRDRPFLLPEVRQPEAIDALNQPNVVFFDRRSLPKYGSQQLGLRTELEQRSVTIGGHFTLGGGLATDGTLIASDQNFMRYFALRSLEKLDLGLIKLDPGANAEEIVRQLRGKLPSDVTAYTKAEMIERDRVYWLETTAVGFIFSLGVGVALIVGAAIVYQILYADIAKNYKEYATLKAIGFRNAFLLAVVLQESVLLGGMGYIPGLIGALGAYQFIVLATGGAIPILMPLTRVVVVLGLTVLMCAAAGCIAVRKVLVADPASVF